jgi:hypothetical protein
MKYYNFKYEHTTRGEADFTFSAKDYEEAELLIYSSFDIARSEIKDHLKEVKENENNY